MWSSFLLKVTAPISFTTPSHKSLVVGFEPGQGTPLHPAGPATYYVVEGEGWITEDTTRHEIKPGSVVVVGGGVQRRIEAKTRLIILAARGG
jgi:quercetin dioxygenase-like cupin family protein